MPRFRALAVTTVLSGVLAAALIAPPANAAQDYQRYVALGDSFASVGTLTKFREDAPGCARATDNYPSVIAAKLAPTEFVDISCGGAQTREMTAPQGQNPPQFSALTADTDLVTVSIGGNDIGFGEIITTCAKLSFTNPLGAPCKAHYAGVLEERIAQLAPKITAVVDGIAQRSPNATIVVVGYLRILPPTTGCWPVVPFAVGDVPYFDGIERVLNETIGASAEAAGAVFVNPGLTTGHDVCQLLPWNKWVEGLLPTSLSVPVHPNAAGQRHVGGLVAAALSD
ncbi:SGNH/GDSL hydrolase family protein [Actinokineospora iranica]|uniref:GDSL-like Lipase/Acylhydrolase family protein n=1 Tax=Actinokineospora iranica TaxID=1271860 RepID=A0A1G6W4Q9_9PSEU|nr:SGNH/GDSL hydrolase family protein [Actinokineospora iranica]SDD60778.1 GDSL-like Lipase/Acylhydrolase family protein [Actinokineospora iranica]